MFAAPNGIISGMTATLTLDEDGQIHLPEALKRAFGAEPGVRVRAEVTADRIEIVKEIPVAIETSRSPSGRLVLARSGKAADAAKATREERDALAERARKR
jgi:bifunctional DNA-binding transcriptional regulator/antitoxin component of YhaV-PrlF toxin-antitoxin module